MEMELANQKDSKQIKKTAVGSLSVQLSSSAEGIFLVFFLRNVFSQQI